MPHYAEEEEHEEEIEEAFTYQIAKTAPFPKIMISTLAHDYKAPDFLYHITHSRLQTSGIETAVLEGGRIFGAEGYRPCNEGSHRENHYKGYQEGAVVNFLH